MGGAEVADDGGGVLSGGQPGNQILQAPAVGSLGILPVEPGADVVGVFQDAPEGEDPVEIPVGQGLAWAEGGQCPPVAAVAEVPEVPLFGPALRGADGGEVLDLVQELAEAVGQSQGHLAGPGGDSSGLLPPASGRPAPGGVIQAAELGVGHR